MDAAFDPPPALEMEPRELVRGEGAKATRCFTTVLLRAMRASREPSLTREESIAWASYVVVKIAARMIRCHPTPSAFDELLRAMAATRVVDADSAGDGASWRPTRRAAGWLLLRELRRDRGAETRASRWAMELATRIAAEGGPEEGGGGGVEGERYDRAREYERTLFGSFEVDASVDAGVRAFFFL